MVIFRGRTEFFDKGPKFSFWDHFFMLDGLNSSNLAGSGLVQSRGCHWAHQISGSCWFYLIFCQFGVLRAQKLIKMCTKMFVFSVANSQNTYYGLKRVFFGISEMGTPPILKGRRGLSAENSLCSSTAAPDSGWTWHFFICVLRDEVTLHE